MKKSMLVSLLLGIVAASLLAFTTDQIWQAIYNSTSNAIQVTVVSGGGTPVAVGTAYTTVADEATPLAQRAIVNFSGAPVNCVDNSGAARTDCTVITPTPIPAVATATPQPTATPGTGGASPVTITLANASSTGTTTNKLAKINADGTAVISATTDTTNAIGPVVSGAGTTGSAVIQIIGSASCVFDGATTAGDFVTISSTTAGDCHDAGTTFPSFTSVLGIVTTTNGGGGTYTAIFETPDIMNVTNLKGGNPGKYPTAAPTATPRATDTPIVALSYSSALNSTSITAISASATPAATDRYIRCTSGSSSDQTYTLPAATGTGRIIEIKKIDSGTKNCIVGRAGADLIDGATSYTLSAQYQAVTVFDAASAVWDVL
jgi:hypothetical protein